MNDELLTSYVKVRQMNIRWLKREGKNFLDLIEIIKDTRNEALLQTSFVNSLFEKYWSVFQKRIFYT